MKSFVAACTLLLGFIGNTSFAVEDHFDPSADRSKWTQWSPRPENAPRFDYDSNTGRAGKGALKLSTSAESDFGAWRSRVPFQQSDGFYKFSAWYKAKGVPNQRRSVIARVQWLDAKGKELRPPEYALDVRTVDGWTEVELISPAPENASEIDVQLSLGFAANAQLWWDDLTFAPLENRSPRKVRVSTVFHRPRGTKSAAESVEQFCQLAATAERPDIICLPEGISVVGTGKSYAEVGEAIPGPTTDRLGQLARKKRAYVVAGIYEMEGKVLYNTAVLIGRDGKIVGTYRKTHLPREEWEAGITPGNEYPVFDTDFGRVGLIICWDVQFPEPCRALGAKGAELVLLPIWGGNELLAKARAIENHLYLVSSSYDMKSFVVDPVGSVRAEATAETPIVTAELDLNQIYWQPWLGNMKNRTWKEWRPDLGFATGKRSP